MGLYELIDNRVDEMSGGQRQRVLLAKILAQGAEGIAVGLSTKILPHNFVELLKASIQHLKGKKFNLYPDFHLHK